MSVRRIIPQKWKADHPVSHAETRKQSNEEGGQQAQIKTEFVQYRGGDMGIIRILHHEFCCDFLDEVLFMPGLVCSE